MSSHGFAPEDIEALAEILENECKSHRKRRLFCLSLFVFSLVLLIAGMVGVAWLTIVDHRDALELRWANSLTALGAITMGAFGAWYASQNCIHSIERTLYAARAGREKLFVTFLQQVQCAGKEKRRVWLDLAKDIVIG